MHIDWDDTLTGGIDEIDEQHKDLIVTFNQLVDACIGSPGPARPALIINLLTGKVKEHCRAEESLLEAHGYTKTKHHGSDHNPLIKNIEDLEYWFLTGGNPDLKRGSVMAIGQQLLDHTRSDDVDAFSFVNETPKR